MILRVCDICKKNSPDVKIKYKAKRFWSSWYEFGWEKIELCQSCLDKIIKAKSEVNYSIKTVTNAKEAEEYQIKED